MRLRIFLFFIGPTALLTASIHFSDTGRGRENYLKLGFDSFIKYFISRVQFLIPTIYLGLDKRLEIFSQTPNQYFLVKSRNKVKLLKQGL